MRLAAVAIACAGAAALSACSGGGGTAREHPRHRVTGADRLAFYHLATTTGTLRLVISGAAIGRPQPLRRRDSVALRLADARLGQIAPRDPKLRRALVVLRPSVGRVARARDGRPIPKAVARPALAAADRTTRLLRAFAHRHPGLGSLLPD